MYGDGYDSAVESPGGWLFAVSKENTTLCMKRAFFVALLFVIIYALLWVAWLFVSDLYLFPNDIIGTHYEVPLPNHNRLVSVVVDYGEIVDDADDVFVRRVDSLQVVGDFVVGRDAAIFFSFNTISKEVVHFDSISQLIESQGLAIDSMFSPSEFYGNHRKPFDTLAGIVIAVISLGLSLLFTRRGKKTNSTQ